MSRQVQGVLGRMVDRMIRRSVRARFRNVYWIPPAGPLEAPVILAANHHSWFDGYLMYHVVTALDLPSVDWIEEFDSFPLFRHVGGMPFPRNDSSARGATIKQTLKLMKSEGKSLVIFPEGLLHRPHNLLPFGKALEFVAEKVPQSLVIPVALRYDVSLHERPEAFIALGDPVERGDALAERTRLAVKSLLDIVAVKMAHEPEEFEVLAKGTQDVNERWDMRRIRRVKGKKP